MLNGSHCLRIPSWFVLQFSIYRRLPTGIALTFFSGILPPSLVARSADTAYLLAGLDPRCFLSVSQPCLSEVHKFLICLWNACLNLMLVLTSRFNGRNSVLFVSPFRRFPVFAKDSHNWEYSPSSSIAKVLKLYTKLNKIVHYGKI